MLETLRALKAGPPLDRDVIALLTDGEEIGFLGSRLFVNEHPWAKDVGVVLNFDARGNSGPSIMFETSDGNGWLIGQYAQAVTSTARHLGEHGHLQDHAQLLGPDGLQASRNGRASISLSAPAWPTITRPKIRRKTSTSARLQHQGENALATARHFGRLDLDDTKQDDVIYTSILNRIVVSYSKKWILPLAFFALALFLALADRSRAFKGPRSRSPTWSWVPAWFSLQSRHLCSLTGILFVLGVCWSVLRARLDAARRSPG